MKKQMSTYIIMALLLSSWGMTPVALATEVEDTGLEENTSFGNNELTEDQMATTDTSQSEEGSDEKSDVRESTMENTRSTEEQLQGIMPTYIYHGNWGTAPVSFDDRTGTLVVSAGIIENTAVSSSIPAEKVINIIFEKGAVAPADASYLFSGYDKFVKLKSITGYLDTSNVTTMSHMFYDTTNLEEVEISHWNLSNVTDMYSMFEKSGITKLDLANWDTSNVTRMAAIFSQATSLAQLDISGWMISDITDVEDMFNGCINLRTLTIGAKTKFNHFVSQINENFLPAIDTTSGQFTGAWERIHPQEPVSVYENSYDFMTMYDGGLPGTYSWQKVSTQFTVDFISDGGSEVSSQSVRENEQVTKPMDPTKDGYTFAGWFTDETHTQLFDFKTPITQAIILYAKWLESESAEEEDRPTNTSETNNQDLVGNQSNKKKLPHTGDSKTLRLTILGSFIFLYASLILIIRKKSKKAKSVEVD